MPEHLFRVLATCLLGSILFYGLAQLKQLQPLRKHVRHGGRRPGSTPGGELR